MNKTQTGVAPAPLQADCLRDLASVPQPSVQGSPGGAWHPGDIAGCQMPWRSATGISWRRAKKYSMSYIAQGSPTKMGIVLTTMSPSPWAKNTGSWVTSNLEHLGCPPVSESHFKTLDLKGHRQPRSGRKKPILQSRFHSP